MIANFVAQMSLFNHDNYHSYLIMEMCFQDLLENLCPEFGPSTKESWYQQKKFNSAMGGGVLPVGSNWQRTSVPHANHCVDRGGIGMHVGCGAAQG